jgi:nucleotide-binding universal stress UspA family protein
LKKLKSILCPIDFSEHSQNLVNYAISFGEKYELLPRLLHICTKPPDVYYRFFPDFSTYLTAIEENTQTKLNSFLKNFDASLESEIQYGTISQTIDQYVAEKPADLIMISAHAFSNYDDESLSTVALKVVRNSEAPVITLYGNRKQANIKKILCPTDLSPRSYNGLKQAAWVARKFNAKIYLLHVVELHEFGKRKIKKYFTDDAFSKLSEALIDQLKIPQDLQDLDIEKVISRNVDAAAAIAHFATQNDIDMIAMTTHGRGYWPHVLLGCVTEKVMQISPCPVLTIRTKK